MSDIQDYTEYIIKKYKTLTANPPIYLCINTVNNRIVFKIKDGYKLELSTPETMKLFGGTKKLIDKTKNGENVSSLQEVEVVLVQCNLVDNQYQQKHVVVLVQGNLVDNQYQQKHEVLYTFIPDKSYAYLLNVEPSNSVFLKTYKTEFDEIIITYMDQNDRALEIEKKVNLTLLIMISSSSLATGRYSMEPRTRKYVKEY